MSMTAVVTRNVSPRVRGFLASAMLEVAPGVYSAPRISPAVRDRVWGVLEEWFVNEREASIVMLWQDKEMPGGQAMRVLGSPPVTLIDVDGLLLARRAASPD
ncbi:type I-E CRISPR-associated endoribonuclease Cas2e [Thioalkalivibrio thiocyanodenitrificans]|uniref:type I-E CRISPR-associated endoribonuclease Cas2e n=1 Tax=Thioalkalivibrio thiocyanodenitrificans TaxID=243063 RepID=UPI0009FFFF49|nr:type I-E CRISPR-associated endoribonuclease Cas2e [Thioalkalivibrio thiocyanodenitrificans]